MITHSLDQQERDSATVLLKSEPQRVIPTLIFIFKRASLCLIVSKM
ncbi:hypothetical protein VRK_27520 [Vibrio sp. MEBiC08052]|nr:hypothetical protein VRK_27520 [Vibrio sp. MEBiC08052]